MPTADKIVWDQVMPPTSFQFYLPAPHFHLAPGGLVNPGGGFQKRGWVWVQKKCPPAGEHGWGLGGYRSSFGWSGLDGAAPGGPPLRRHAPVPLRPPRPAPLRPRPRRRGPPVVRHRRCCAGGRPHCSPSQSVVPGCIEVYCTSCV